MVITGASSGIGAATARAAAARGAFPGIGAYAASKAALNMLSAVARKEFAQYGIVVSTVYPFITATEFHQVLRAGTVRAGAPAGDPPEHVADLILDLVETGDEERSMVRRG